MLLPSLCSLPLSILTHCHSPYQTLASLQFLNSHSASPQSVSPVHPVINPTQHFKVIFPTKYTCATCWTVFPRNSDLEKHASSTRHPSFRCFCGTHFGRAACLTRHVNAHDGSKIHRCDWCDDKAFPRLDKLRDHLRNFHRFNYSSLSRLRGGPPVSDNASGEGASSSASSHGSPESHGDMFNPDPSGLVAGSEISSDEFGFGSAQAAGIETVS